MRAPLLVLVALGCATPAAHADGAMSLRGVWYKEKATRVIQPMVDAAFDVGDAGEADAHALVDAITSASTAAGAAGQAFSERRWEIGGGYRHLFDKVRLGGSARFSYEPDYTSLFAGGGAELLLRDQTTTIGASGGLGHDTISKSGPTAPNQRATLGRMTMYLGSLSVTQVMTPNRVAGLTYDLIYLEGFQENPYRTAITADGLVEERHPDTRLRHAIAGTVRQFVPATITTVIATYRFYNDDWGIVAHTPEARVVQEAGDGVDVTLRYRYHWQRKADFYLPSYPSNDMDEFPHVTDDIKLSGFTTHTVGVKFGVIGHVLGFGGRLEDARGELIMEYIDQNNRFGNAVIAHAALTLPFEY
jgi:hypothetical protein